MLRKKELAVGREEEEVLSAGCWVKKERSWRWVG